MNCPCGHERSYDECCGPFIQGDAFPETAEALMRSRYSAYVKNKLDYIVETHRPPDGDEPDREYIEALADGTKWLGLDIIETDKGGPDDEAGIVEFSAHYADDEDGSPATLHERSIFHKIEGRWYYTDTEVEKPVRVTKVGRNEPCPCGSGKKYKKCCGR